MRNYKIDKNVTIVIYDDRASWTRKGLGTFPRRCIRSIAFISRRELPDLIWEALTGACNGCMKELEMLFDLQHPGF